MTLTVAAAALKWGVTLIVLRKPRSNTPHAVRFASLAVVAAVSVGVFNGVPVLDLDYPEDDCVGFSPRHFGH